MEILFCLERETLAPYELPGNRISMNMYDDLPLPWNEVGELDRKGRKVARPEGRGDYRCCLCSTLMETIRRVVYEEKQLVLQDWTAKGSAEDGLREGLAGNSG